MNYMNIMNEREERDDIRIRPFERGFQTTIVPTVYSDSFFFHLFQSLIQIICFKNIEFYVKMSHNSVEVVCEKL